ncbi:hypothetical protein B0T10DRAFT_534280 [Thelonectria olida]|uniref:Uncharacterized protein n=1 Tax=Thelonectria olida TaxID=1576542 RepID=A0A9P8VQT6_9HYPO|nr:hypothetical protein B0T10DRAFT_534280 [Thelonectria olida]
MTQDTVHPLDMQEKILEELGYKPELTRDRSTMQVAFMAFVLASVPYGVSTTLNWPVVGGGPPNSVLGVYYQAFMLSPSRWRRVPSWICGWLYVVGNISITLSVNSGTALFLVSCINTAAIFWTLAGVLAIIITILVLAKNGRHDAKYVFTHFETSSGWPDGWSFCVGLLHAAYATSSTGMITSMCEESIQFTRAMVETIFINTFAGLLFLIPLVFVMPDIQWLISVSGGQPVPFIIKSAVGTTGGSLALLIPLPVLGIMCGIGCTTTSSRCTWAFARDGAISGSRWWGKIDQKLHVPLNAMMFCMAIETLLGFTYFGSSAAYNAFSGAGVICLNTAYATPIAISLLTGRKQIEMGRFNLGLRVFCNIAAVGWCLLMIPLFCMPSTLPVAAVAVNYAPVVFVAAGIISGVWYWIWGYENYIGPPTGGRD